tara:strand:- start:1348 stop:1533 length:186 start_codon:yes stop_codon:yes gene_type:complete
VNSITVEIKNKYGVDYIYPVCPKAQDFADIANTKTLTPYVISVIKNLGFKVLVKPNTPEEL